MSDQFPPPPPGGPPPPPPPGGGGFPPPPPPGAPPPPPPGGQPPPGQGWAQPAPQQGTPQLAGFGARLGAFLLDALILGVPIGIVFVALIAALPRGEPELCEDLDGDLAICEPLTGSSVAILVILGLILFAGIVYFWWGKLLGEQGQTPGKKAVGIKVVGTSTGQPVGMGRGIGRGLMAQFISGNVCLLGYLWMLWDGKNQTWHDKVADSVVVSGQQ
ncbi:MAG: RDD family protein, partial [Acidimicrobiales bacterium]